MGNIGTNELKNSIRSGLREQMAVCQKWAYFDHAAVGPLPKPAAKAIRKWADQAENDGDIPWPEWSAAANRARQSAAELLHCQAAEIALVPSTTFGINVVSSGYPWQPGDSLVVLSNEFSSNLLPWVQLSSQGIEVRRVPIDDSGVVEVDHIRRYIDRSTRLVSVSWVGYATGFRLDLAKICEMVHAAGAKLFVDAIQGLGVFPLNTQLIPIDYLAADGHKWLLGPEGAGILYIQKSNLSQLLPVMSGWGSLKSSHHFQTENMSLKEDASRYEGGSTNHSGFIGLSESIQLLLALGCNQIESGVQACVLENAARIEQELMAVGAHVFRPRALSASEINDSSMSGIVSFTLPHCDPQIVRLQLIEAGIVLSVRHGRLRVATHAYNNLEDIERLISRVREISAS